MKKEEKKLKVGQTVFHLNNFTNMTKERFLEIYSPTFIQINGIKWEPESVWKKIQDEMINVGLKENDKELRKVHAK